MSLEKMENDLMTSSAEGLEVCKVYKEQMVILCVQLAIREFSKISLDPRLAEARPSNASMNMEDVARFVNYCPLFRISAE